MTESEIQNLKKLSSVALLSFAKSAAQRERHFTLQVLHALQELDRRKYFLELGYSSLHQFCVEALGYSDGSAARRVQAARLLRDIPDIESKIVDGSISLSVAAQAPEHQSNRNSRAIPARIKRAVWERDLGCCAYIDPRTQRRCGSKIRLEFDHYPLPFAQGGEHSLSNLRLACHQHNSFYAAQIFGDRKMSQFHRDPTAARLK